MKRCKWCNLRSAKYVEYHDKEWGVLNTDDRYLFEMLLLESFQAGLSWECILNKRDSFKKAYDNFDLDKVCMYDERKVSELLNNKNIIRNRFKITSSINNAKIFKNIIKEYGSFKKYLDLFTKGNILYETGKVTNKLSDEISSDLRNRGMKYTGSTIIYSYLQAVGYIYSHDEECDLYRGG